MEPPNKGHYGKGDRHHFVPFREAVPISEIEYYTISKSTRVKTSVLCREVVPISEVEYYTISKSMRVKTSVLCREVVPISEGPLLEVPLWLINVRGMC